MNNAEKLISQYHTECLVCLGLAMIFLAVTVFLFVHFHIPALFAARSGRARKRSIREIEARNARSDRPFGGRVRVQGNKPSECLNDEESGKSGRPDDSPGDKPPKFSCEREEGHTELLQQDTVRINLEQTRNKGEKNNA
ncbi:MAG: hypothetical protein LUC27_01585 [Lachnospiraceae bacterium]|nr:hypothetical protein [Lachnospiraceae bacterium]